MRNSSDKTPVTPGGVGTVVEQLHSELLRAKRLALAGHGIALNYSQAGVLRRLGEHGPMCAAELTRAFPYDSGGMTRLIDQLEKRGLVQRRPDPADRRVQDIVLTTAGKKLIRPLAAIGEEVLDQALGNLRASERARLMGYLQRMLASLRGPR